MPPQTPIDKNTLPRQQGLRIPGPGIKPVDYGSLFPFDPLGNTIANRRQAAATPPPGNRNVQRQS